jgi:hypothetical protein
MSPNPQQWFKFDIPLFDEWIRKLPAEAGILLCVIVRKMAAWDKTEDTISRSQLVAMSGMHEKRVRRNMRELVNSGAPVRVAGRGKDGTTYAIDWRSDAGVQTSPEEGLHSDAGVRTPVDPQGSHSDAGVQTEVLENQHSDAGVQTRCWKSSIRTLVTPTTDTPKGINRTETDGGVETVSVSVDPAPVSLEGSPANRDNPAEESDVPVSFPIPSQPLHEGEGLVVGDELPNTTPNTSQLLNQQKSVSVVHPGLGPKAQPEQKQKQKHSIKSKGTGRWYELGVNDADYVADVLQISLKDARGIMHDCPGANGYQLLCVVLDENTNNEKNIAGSKNRAGYVRTIVRANVTRILAQDPFPQGRKANKSATVTGKPLPRSAAPLPTAAEAQEARILRDRTDGRVRDAIHALGNTGHTAKDIGAQMVKDGGGENSELKLQRYFKGMIGREKMHFRQGCDRIVLYVSLEPPSKTVAASPAPESPAITHEASQETANPVKVQAATEPAKPTRPTPPPVPRAPLTSEKQAQAALTAAAKPDSLTAATDKRDAAVLEAFEKLGMGTGGNGKFTLVELGTHLECPMTSLQNLCAHLASMSSRGLIHHESGTGLYCSMAAPRMPAVAVETQEVSPNASELLESATAVEEAAADDDEPFSTPGLPDAPEFPDVHREEPAETVEGPVTPAQAPVTVIDISSMPPGLSWPEKVVEYVRRGGQDLVAIAAAIDQSLASIQNVVRFHGDIETRYEHGHPHYYVPPTVPEVIQPRAVNIEDALATAAPVTITVSAPPVDDPVVLRRKILECLDACPDRDLLSAAAIHAAVCPIMDVDDLDFLLQRLGCNGEIEMIEMGPGECEFRANEPDEPLDAVEEPAEAPAGTSHALPCLHARSG